MKKIRSDSKNNKLMKLVPVGHPISGFALRLRSKEKAANTEINRL